MSTLVLTIRNERSRIATSRLDFSIANLDTNKRLKAKTRKRNDKRQTVHLRFGKRTGRFSVSIKEKNSFDRVLKVDFPDNMVVSRQVTLRSKWQIPPVSKLAGKLKSLLLEYLRRKKLGKWKDLTEEEQTTYLAITRALSQVHIGSDTSLDHIAKLKEIAGDPSGKRGNATVFRLYTHQTASFKKWIKDGARYIDQKGKPRRTKWARGHKGYPKSRKTQDGRPNLQWAYTKNGKQADIDLDGKSGPAHLTRGNSDVREWYNKFKKKHGNPGFVLRTS